MSTSAFLAVSSRRGDSFTFWAPWSVQLASKMYVDNALLPPSVVSLAVRGESRPLCVTPAANLADFSTDRYDPMYHPGRPGGGEPARCLGGHCARSAVALARCSSRLLLCQRRHAAATGGATLFDEC